MEQQQPAASGNGAPAPPPTPAARAFQARPLQRCLQPNTRPAPPYQGHQQSALLEGYTGQGLNPSNLHSTKGGPAIGRNLPISPYMQRGKRIMTDAAAGAGYRRRPSKGALLTAQPPPCNRQPTPPAPTRTSSNHPPYPSTKPTSQRGPKPRNLARERPR